MQFYRRTSRELQRLDSISRTPIYTQFSETLSGVDVIRAYNDSDRFIRACRALFLKHASYARVVVDNERRINYNQRAYWMVQATNRWYTLFPFMSSLLTNVVSG